MLRNLYNLIDFGLSSNDSVAEVRLRKGTFGFGSELGVCNAEVEYRNTFTPEQMNLVITGLKVVGNFLDDLGRKICQRWSYVMVS